MICNNRSPNNKVQLMILWLIVAAPKLRNKDFHLTSNPGSLLVAILAEVCALWVLLVLLLLYSLKKYRKIVSVRLNTETAFSLRCITRVKCRAGVCIGIQRSCCRRVNCIDEQWPSSVRGAPLAYDCCPPDDSSLLQRPRAARGWRSVDAFTLRLTRRRAHWRLQQQKSTWSDVTRWESPADWCWC